LLTIFEEIKEGKHKTLTDRINISENQTNWLELFFSPIKNENGKILRILIFAYDISDIYRYESKMSNLRSEIQSREYSLKIIESHNERNKKLLQSEKLRIDSFLNGLSKVFLRMDYSPEGIILDFNRKFEEITGLSKTEVLGSSIRTGFMGASYSQFESIWESAASGEASEEIIQIHSKVQKNIYLLKTDIPIYGAKGNVEKMVLAAFNITAFFQQ
jgi:PAS domain S-box-containing protein